MEYLQLGPAHTSLALTKTTFLIVSRLNIYFKQKHYIVFFSLSHNKRGTHLPHKTQTVVNINIILFSFCLEASTFDSFIYTGKSTALNLRPKFSVVNAANPLILLEIFHIHIGQRFCHFVIRIFITPCCLRI